jgi:hypothetical protein
MGSHFQNKIVYTLGDLSLPLDHFCVFDAVFIESKKTHFHFILMVIYVVKIALNYHFPNMIFQTRVIKIWTSEIIQFLPKMKSQVPQNTTG